MSESSDIQAVLSQFLPGESPQTIESLGGAGGFSGARFWRLSAARSDFCLRRWPEKHPTTERLAWIHCVLEHVASHGIHILPVPVRSTEGASFVEHERHLWELSPWMPGKADYFEQPSPEKLCAALGALAEFHRASASLETVVDVVPAVSTRCKRLDALMAGGFHQIERGIHPHGWPELATRAARIIESATTLTPSMRRELETYRECRLRLQPVIRDIWHDHVLFVGNRVSGLVDFGAMQLDSIATDIARLVGSMAGDDHEARQAAIAAYESISPLSDDEAALVNLLDRTGTVIGAVNWLDWIYCQGRQFDERPTIIARLDTMLTRIEAW